MKTILTLSLLLSMSSFSALANDNYSAGEKAADVSRDAGRGIKKGYHRTKEAVCMKGDAECAAQKAKHRVIETKDAAVDGAKDMKNKVD